MFDDCRCEIKYTMQKVVAWKRFLDGTEASLVSGVQGLDPKQNFQSFRGLVRVKE